MICFFVAVASEWAICMFVQGRVLGYSHHSIPQNLEGRALGMAPQDGDSKLRMLAPYLPECTHANKTLERSWQGVNKMSR